MISTLEYFYDENFDAENFVEDSRAEGAEASPLQNKLDETSVIIQEQLKFLIAENYGDLCTQAVAVDSLEDQVSSACTYIQKLQSKLEGGGKRVTLTQERMEETIVQLENVYTAENSLLNLIRFLELWEEQKQEADIVELASIVDELLSISEGGLLKGVKVVEKQLLSLPRLRQDTILNAQSVFRTGLSKGDLLSLTEGILAFNNLLVADEEAQSYSEAYLQELDKILTEMTKVPAVQESPKRHCKTKIMPGSASLPSLSVCAVQSSIWPSFDILFKLLSRYQVEARVLKHVGRQSSVGPDGHRIVAAFSCGLPERLAECMALKIQEHLESSSVLVYSLRDEYPQFLLRFNQALLNYNPQGNMPEDDVMRKEYAILRDAWRPLETSYLAKSLSRLLSAVESAFRSEPFQSANISKSFYSLMHEELSAACGDPSLLRQVCKSVSKTIYQYCSKCEQSSGDAAEASQIIDCPNATQKRNVEIVNSLTFLSARLQSLLLDPTYRDCVPLLEACRYMETVMEAILLPLKRSVEGAIASVMATIHQEDFATLAKKRLASTTACSLYVKELQAVAQFCISEESFAPTKAAMKAFQTMLNQSCTEVAQNKDRWINILSPSLVIQLLMSMNDGELPSPHSTVRWTLSRYVEWWDEHQSETERLRFLESTLCAYENFVHASNKSEYATSFLVISELLKTLLSVET
ncbi:hypothetical protein M513_05158 [Trichuris suis]|uniref:Uncharacterized protein n=1 Tax=Trichuris suis TaxID=68888 RepID=A0A085M9J5_9BILA|nr:hypothetical protein M513_05158 [Trichuris suis]